MKCPTCQEVLLVRHHEIEVIAQECGWYRNGGQSCDDFRAEKTKSKAAEDATQHAAAVKFLVDNGAKQCPRCLQWAEKTGGDNAMKCRCGCGFCYLCGKDKTWSDAHPHFGQPGMCYGWLFEGIRAAYE